MDAPRLTEERLRTWLDTDQSQRERMCIALLSLSPEYSNIQPRRPKGGPDGGRDLRAVYRDQWVAWGAIGFKNGATDSSEDKRWVKKKFEDDLKSAQEAVQREGNDVKVFVFFTNIDLTPAEQEEFQELGQSRGFQKVDLFYRERLRILLDSPEGLGIRFQYLAMRLSDAEQASFFARFGVDLERLLVHGFGTVDQKLERLEFLQNCNKRLVDLRLVVALVQPASPTELGHFRALMAIADLSGAGPHPTVWLGVRDAYSTFHRGTEEHLLPGVKTLAWASVPEAELQNTVIGAFSSGTLAELVAATGVHGHGPFHQLGDIDRKTIGLFVTENVLERLAGVVLIANGYQIISLPKSAFVTREGPALAEWREELSPEEQAVRWVSLGLRADRPGPYPEKRFFTDFDGYTPRRLR